MTQQDVGTLLRENLAAFSAGDMERLGATLADDSVYDELSTQRKVQGRDEQVKIFTEWRQAFPDATGTIQNIFASGDQAVAEILWEGTQTGDMAGPEGTIPASGKPVSVRASMVVRAEGGRLKESRHYFDLMTLLRQIGAIR